MVKAFTEFVTLSRRLTSLTDLLRSNAQHEDSFSDMVREAFAEEATVNQVLEALEGTSFFTLVVMLILLLGSAFWMRQRMIEVRLDFKWRLRDHLLTSFSLPGRRRLGHDRRATAEV